MKASDLPSRARLYSLKECRKIQSDLAMPHTSPEARAAAAHIVACYADLVAAGADREVCEAVEKRLIEFNVELAELLSPNVQLARLRLELFLRRSSRSDR